MARTLRRLRPLGGAAPLALLWGLPLLLSLIALVPVLADRQAWALLLAHPQLVPALALSLFTGFAAAALALVLTLFVLAGLHGRAAGAALQGLTAAGLALPHLAFAIGFAFLVMPSGLLARLLVGGETPPAWMSVQDPAGLSLVAALTLKEIPFLLTAAFAALARGEAEGGIAMQLRAARSLGHARGSAFLRIVLPQLLKELRWPLVIVFVYGATVVDMALVLGPTQPPTLSVVIWHALNDAEPQTNAMGLAGTILLTAGLGAVMLALALCHRAARAARRRFLTAGPSLLEAPRLSARALLSLLFAVFAATLLLLLLLSFAPRWPYPAVWPPAMDHSSWAALAAAPGPLLLSLALALSTSVVGTGLAVLWLETQPPVRDRWPLALALLSLALPQLAVAGGQYRLFLEAGFGGTLWGLFLAHLTPVAAYVLIVLQGPWRAFDGRYVQAARALCASPVRAFLKVKLPLLKAPLLMAAAIGFAVSLVQFVPAQLVAAGRYSTLPMEAVTLSSGGSRPLTAAFALALAVPPLLVLLAAALTGRPRWR